MNSIIGQLTPYNTIIHRIDPRVKIFGLLCLMVTVFLPYSNSSYIDDNGVLIDNGYFCNQFIVLGIAFLIVIILMILSKVSLVKFLKSLSAMWITFIFLFIIFIFIPSSQYKEVGHIMYSFDNGYTLYWDSCLQCAHIFLRLVIMLALTLILTSTTSPMDITYALEWYFTPLRLIKIPTQIFSLILSLALRFIPTLLEESQRIAKSQKSRGVDYKKGFFTKKIKSMFTLIIPLLVSCFLKSDELALAMDARGYDPYSKRSKYRNLHFRFVDFIYVILILIVLGFFIFLCVLAVGYHIDFFEYFGLGGLW